MRSIRQRLFIQIGSLILLLLGLILIANTVFLEQYYVKRQTTQLIESYRRINDIEESAYEDSMDTFIAIESSANIDIVLFDADGEAIYFTKEYFRNEAIRDALPGGQMPGRQPQGQAQGKGGIPTPAPGSRKLKSIDGVEVVQGNDPLTGDMSLVLWAELDDGSFLNLRMPMASIRTNIEMMNRFLLIIGGVVLIVAVLVTYLLSGSFTKPIRQMNQTALRLKDLDFSSPSQVKTQDELGELSNSINAMSASLENTITSLDGSNRQLKAEISAKNLLDEKRRQLLNNVSHELKTPLALMQGYADALKLHISRDPDRVDFYCDVIVDETQKMNQLVQHLLDIDQVEFGDISSHPERIQLTDYVADSVKKYHPQFLEAGIALTESIAPNITVLTDPLRLDQIMNNYLSNALHYTTDNKKASVTLKVVEADDAIDTQDFETDLQKKAVIEVFNTSRHIPEDKQAKLWDSFYKIDKARTREVGGHGLGLSIVKAIQEADGNGYGCYNTEDGVVFWFDLPIG